MTARRPFRADFDESVRYHPAVALIIASLFPDLPQLADASPRDDEKRGIDMISADRSLRLGWRGRDPKYMSQYGDQYTIRATRPRRSTELAKLRRDGGPNIAPNLSLIHI